MFAKLNNLLIAQQQAHCVYLSSEKHQKSQKWILPGQLLTFLLKNIENYLYTQLEKQACVAKDSFTEIKNKCQKV